MHTRFRRSCRHEFNVLEYEGRWRVIRLGSDTHSSRFTRLAFTENNLSNCGPFT